MFLNDCFVNSDSTKKSFISCCLYRKTLKKTHHLGNLELRRITFKDRKGVKCHSSSGSEEGERREGKKEHNFIMSKRKIWVE